MASRLTLKPLIMSFLRSNACLAAYNQHGLQNIGFLYAMMPGLTALYPDEHKLAEACRRYAAYHNCHPAWNSFLVGAFLHLEGVIASGRADAALIGALKESTLNSLSALGDSFFSGSLNIGLMLVIACLIAYGLFWAGAVLMFVWLLLSLVLRGVLFIAGLRHGLSGLNRLRRYDLINKGGGLKVISAITLTTFLSINLESSPLSLGAKETATLGQVMRIWGLPMAGLCLFTYVVCRLHVPRTLILTLIIAIVSLSQFVRRYFTAF